MMRASKPRAASNALVSSIVRTALVLGKCKFESPYRRGGACFRYSKIISVYFEIVFSIDEYGLAASDGR